MKKSISFHLLPVLVMLLCLSSCSETAKKTEYTHSIPSNVTEMASLDVKSIVSKAELLHLDLPEDVAEFIANHLKNNIRQLEGAVKKLNAYYMLEGIQPVISVAQNAIKDILNETQPVPVTIEKIVGEVSRTFNVSPADIRGTKRNANVASARRVAIYILREVTGMSMEEIGREFSGRDHSTIVYSLKTMERDMKNDQHLRETVSDIIKNVKA